MAKHYTLVDLFEKKFYTQHPTWMAVSDYLPDDLCVLLIQHLNPKPGDNVPVPKVIICFGDWDPCNIPMKCEFTMNFDFFVWCLNHGILS